MTERSRLIVVVAPIADTTQGDYVYRVRQPFEHLVHTAPDVRAAVISNLLPNKEILLLAADLVIIKMVADADLIALAWERKQSQKSTIFEIADDFLSLPDCNPASGHYRRQETRGILFQILAQCDMVQVTTAALKAKYGRFHPRVCVFENQLKELRPGTAKHEQPTIAWAGSDGHLDDMKSVAPALTRWLQRRNSVQLALKCSSRILELFRGVPGDRLIVEESGSLDSYLDFLSKAHVGIAPLLENEYNRCRSDIKLLEYSSASAAIVCTDLDMYRTTAQQNRAGVLFRDPEALTMRLDELIDIPERRKHLVETARRYAAGKRLEHQHTARRIDCYKSFLEGPPQPLSRLNLSRWPLVELAPGLFEEVRAPETVALLEGMGTRDYERSLPYFAQSIELNSKYDLPFVTAGVILSRRDPERALRYFQHSLALNPSAVYPRLLAGDVLTHLGRIAEAADVFASAWKQCPAYVDPLVRLAGLCSEAGEEERSRRHLKMAAEICPHHPALHDVVVDDSDLTEESDATKA